MSCPDLFGPIDWLASEIWTKRSVNQASRTTTGINLIEHNFFLAADEHRSDWTESMIFFDIGVSLRLLRSVIFRERKREKGGPSNVPKQLMMEHLAFT